MHQNGIRKSRRGKGRSKNINEFPLPFHPRKFLNYVPRPNKGSPETPSFRWFYELETPSFLNILNKNHSFFSVGKVCQNLWNISTYIRGCVTIHQPPSYATPRYIYPLPPALIIPLPLVTFMPPLLSHLRGGEIIFCQNN